VRVVELSSGAKRRFAVQGAYERPLAFVPTAELGGGVATTLHGGMSVAAAPGESTGGSVAGSRPTGHGRRLSSPELAERAAYTLSELLRERGLEPDFIYLGLPAELVTLWLLELPFGDRRKIEQVLPFELESQSLTPTDELLFDVLVAPAARGGGAHRVLVAGAVRAQVGHWVEVFAARNLELRGLTAASLAYGALAATGWLGEETAGEGRHGAATHEFVDDEPAPESSMSTATGLLETPGLVALVEVDNDATQVCVLDGARVLFARSLPFAGGPSLPLVRALRQTLAAAHTELGRPVHSLLLGGALGQADAARQWAERELGVAVGRWIVRPPAEVEDMPSRPSVSTPLGGRLGEGREAGRPPVEPWAVLPLAIGLGGALGSTFVQPPVELRRGPFAYKTDLSFLRDKLPALTAALLALIVFSVLDGEAALYKLQREETLLTGQLKAETTKLFGEPRTVDEVQALVTVQQKKSGALIPSRSAYDLLREFSQRIPARDKVKLDVLELEIRPRRTTLKATVDRGDAVDQIVTALKEIDCFTNVQKGKVTSSSGGEQRQFTLTFTTTCP
jgi:type II secretory pathway component PulL